jgi:hypothetical protein
MSNADRFAYHDFTRANYRALVRLAKSHYRFCSYSEPWPANGFVLWRHDVDISVHAAQALAWIEADEGVKATYFLLFHGTYYNLFENDIHRRVKELLSLGHELGLHLDLEFHGVRDVTGLEKAIRMEARWLEDLFGVAPKVFSFHDPGPLALSFRAEQYADLVNCYAERFQTTIGYCSDSNGYWRHRRLEDVLRARTDASLQVLTHPEWWPDEAMSPRRRVHRCIDGRARFLKEYYDGMLRRNGRLNLDDDEAA